MLRLFPPGDGRNDSPGHCAQYCTYTVVENETLDILACIVIDKRETKLISVNMELEALKRVVKCLLEQGINIVEIVTDAHSSITKWLSKFEKYEIAQTISVAKMKIFVTQFILYTENSIEIHGIVR